MDQIKIGNYIANKRKALDMTQMQLAEKLGMSNKSVSKWERGVCLPDVSVYEDLCSVLNISLNEFLAGEDLEPEEIIEQSEKNILGVSHDGKARGRRLKAIIAILAVLLIGTIFWFLNSQGFFRNNYLEPYDKSSDEYNTATILLEPGQASPFHYSVDNSFKSVTLTTYKFKDGEQISEVQTLDTELTSFDENGKEIHEGKGTIAVIMDYRNHKMKLLVTNASSKVSAEQETGTDIRDFDEYGMATSESGHEENIIPGREYAICGYYFGKNEISSADPVEALINHDDNPSGADYSVIVTVRFDQAGEEVVEVPDLSGLSRDEATAALKDAGLMLGNISYYDTSDESDAEVYYQSVPAGDEIAAGTIIDISLRKK
ncbi:MAG: PASTA domain-containing protein [Mogibacterium sp.]|nr:PASTA domain-containing protein [Mogibacterium sp.]